MWKNRYYNIYLTSDPNLIITAVRAFPNIQDTVQKANEYYGTEKLRNDAKYREIMALYYLMDGNCFLPIAFEDHVSKLSKLQLLKPIDKSYFWCIGYVSTHLEGGAKNLLPSGTRKINIPTYKELLEWLIYFTSNYESSTHSGVNQFLARYALTQYIHENSKDKVDSSRLFKLIYNCKNIFFDNYYKGDTTLWIQHLQELPKRDIYEIIVNDFKS